MHIGICAGAASDPDPIVPPTPTLSPMLTLTWTVCITPTPFKARGDTVLGSVLLKDTSTGAEKEVVLVVSNSNLNLNLTQTRTPTLSVVFHLVLYP